MSFFPAEGKFRCPVPACLQGQEGHGCKALFNLRRHSGQSGIGQQNFPFARKKDAVYLLGGGRGPAWESLTMKD